MKPLFAAIPALLLATVVAAQEAPENAQKDLWCGLAFTIVVADVPSDATEEQKVVIRQYADGAVMLIDRATAAYLEAGFTDESFAAHRAALEPEVTKQVSATDNSAQYSFEECSGLLGL